MSTEIEAALTQYILTQVLKRPRYSLKPAEALISSGMIDSFHLVDLALYVEDTYGIHIDDSELTRDTFDTVSQLAELIIARQK